MLLLVLRRVLAAIVLVFAVTSAALLLAQLAPGDYAAQFGRSPEQIAAERHRLGLDRPVLAQYGTWLRRAAVLDFGQSFAFGQPVTQLVRERAGHTAVLAIAALVVATLLGIPAGLLTGSRRRGVIPALIRGLSLTLLSIPPLIGSLLLLAIAARTGWLPISGMGGVSHLVIPTLAIALPLAATLERLQARAIAEALARPSIGAARARGIPPARLVWRHAWRQSLGSVLALYGVLAAALFSGSFVVEIVTSWPGLGDLMLQALRERDTFLVAGCAAAGGVFIAIGVLAADLAHRLVDPRTRQTG